jgi:hypothetical protein
MAALGCFDPNYLAASAAKGYVDELEAISKILAGSIVSSPGQLLLARQYLLLALARDGCMRRDSCSPSTVVLCAPDWRSCLYPARCGSNHLPERRCHGLSARLYISGSLDAVHHRLNPRPPLLQVKSLSF